MTTSVAKEEERGAKFRYHSRTMKRTDIEGKQWVCERGGYFSIIMIIIEAQFIHRDSLIVIRTLKNIKTVAVHLHPYFIVKLPTTKRKYENPLLLRSPLFFVYAFRGQEGRGGMS